MTSDQFRDDLIREMPNLRAFALSLCGAVAQADDLVQDTLVKAWSHSDDFQPGTNLRAWLFTILRNGFYSLKRRQAHEIADPNAQIAESIAAKPEQEGHLHLRDFHLALARLPDEQREALILIGASGLSYEEAAKVCNVAIGTIKSRVNRARARLAEMLDIRGPEDIGDDRQTASLHSRSLQSRSPQRS